MSSGSRFCQPTTSPFFMLRTTTLVLGLVLFTIARSAEGRDGEKGCSFESSGCTYNIYLSRNGGGEDPLQSVQRPDKRLCGQADKRVLLDNQVQNDYSTKLDSMEKSFSFVKDAHEQRLKDLEGTIQELVDTSITRRGRTNSLESEEFGRDKFVLRRSRYGNREFMKRLEVEFDKLRLELRDKSSELLDIRAKLNDTNLRIHEEQLQRFETGQKLLNAENQITMLKRERAVLKNQLKDRSYKLDVSAGKATECEEKSVLQQDEILELFRSESTLKEELLTVQVKLNRSRDEMNLLKGKHAALKTRQERIRRVMKIRERELIECYSAKTSTYCGFEDPKICGFTNINDTSDFFDWQRAQGSTPSRGTGPSKDHTCLAPTGHFMFIEASAKSEGQNAILYSPLYRGLSEQCVEFYYHMHGRNIGTLNVYAQARGDVLNTAWRAFGNQGDHWTNARLAIPKELARAGYNIAFEGIAHNGYMGDISIDDVSVTDGPCPTDEKIVPVKVDVNSSAVLRSGNSFARKLRRKLKKRRGGRQVTLKRN